ncbi:MAG: MocE family 2Fe-2S type ferredoxin [Alphaproteobacteria bacterium]
MPWIDACSTDDIEAEEVIRFDHDGRSFAIYRGPADDFFCTDGLCTHEEVHLADGLVMEYSIECPKHASMFDYRTGEVETPPACEDLNTYPTKVENGRVMIEI